ADTSSRGIVGATLLHQAAQRFGNVDPKFGEIAALLLDAGADFHAVNDFGQTALHLAVDSNNEPCVTVLRGRLEQRATDVFEALANDKPDVPDLTATEFHALISDGQFGIAASLVAAGLPAALASDRSHPAIVAAMGNELLAAALLDAGADPTPTNRGETSLMRAAKHGHERLVARLLKAGLDANAELPTMMETALTMAARAGHLNVIDQLLGAGALVNLWRAGTSPLMIAAHCGHVATVQRLLAAGANPNVVDKAGQTALEGARARGHTDIVRELGQHTNVDLRDRQGRTSLLKACRAGDVQAIRYLLSVGADPGRADEAGDTPLSYAALRAAPSALLSTSFQPVVPARCAATDAQLMALIRGSQDNSVHVTMTDARGDTPLHIAAMRGDQALVVSLLARGAAPEALNAVGETPWAAAIAYGGSKEVEQALLAARGRADVNLQADAYMRSNDFGKAMACGDLRTVDTLLDRFTVGFHRMSAGRSPLTQAARRHDYEMVQLLLAKGADPNVVFFSRFTALHAAVFGPIEIVRQLLHGGADPNAPEVSAGAILYAMEHARGPTMRLLLDSGATMPSEPNLEDFSVEALRTLYEVTIEREMVELAAKVADALRRAATSG
ncbi:MAG TPA: ankyrin repeat domain-containing protein, partial [Polyangiaceae bacterium]|nr:ankyrin repeat domain-containing protein [Polyangiaceae bacterium]